MSETRATSHLIAYCTCPGDDAVRIARDLVQRRVCACVNVIPGLVSVYEWKGKVEEDAEALLIIKTQESQFGELERAVREVHPYEIFELIACRIDRGHRPYMEWIDSVMGM